MAGNQTPARVAGVFSTYFQCSELDELTGRILGFCCTLVMEDPLYQRQISLMTSVFKRHCLRCR